MIEAMKQALEALEASQSFVEASANAKFKDGWGEQLDSAEKAIAAGRQAIALAEKQEPFGYFRAEAFGWTDCAETDEGAKALYEAPQQRQQEQEPALHQWDGSGERCVICGDKDWMGGPCRN